MFIQVPHLGPNDETGSIIELNVASGTLVDVGDDLWSIETTKTVIHVTAPQSGIVYWTINPGDEVVTKQVIGLISNDPLTLEEVRQIMNEPRAIRSSDSTIRFTKKAELFAQARGIDLNDIVESLPPHMERVTEDFVQEFARRIANGPVSPRLGPERVCILGGVRGGGAQLVVDALLDSLTQLPVAVLDSDASTHNETVLGVPVLGGFDMIPKLLGDVADAVVIVFNRDLRERQRLFDDLGSKGTPFTNVVGSHVILRRGVSIGVGNVILGRSFLGTGARIGDNNFLSNGVCLEHDNVLGSHCAFGPAVWTSGAVEIGNRVRFRTGIHVEPSIRIGDDAVICSGACITSDIEAGTIQKSIRSL